MQRDVIIVGGGLAGIMAAFSAQTESAEVLLIDRGSIGVGTNSILAGGVFAAPTSTYSPDVYIKDTLQVGKIINNEPRVKLVAQEAPGVINFLRSLGLNLIESSDHYFLKSSRADVIPGVTLMKKLAEQVKKIDRVNILNSFYVTKILRQNNRLCGVSGFDKSGRNMSIHAPSVVIATGGGGAIYLRNDNEGSGAVGQATGNKCSARCSGKKTKRGFDERFFPAKGGTNGQSCQRGKPREF